MLETARPPWTLPDRIAGLRDLAEDLAWSWNREARAVFHAIDPFLWRLVRHNPITLLARLPHERLATLADDPDFLARYDAALARRAAQRAEDTWYGRTHPEVAHETIAYFCAEFGLHNSVPNYAGGLGVLAGDHCKAASDVGVRLVGVGLLYTRGYFDQRLRPDGWQEDRDETFDDTTTPLRPVRDRKDDPLLLDIPVGDRTIAVGAWRLIAGRSTIYLLDTDLERNPPDDRQLLQRLYAGGSERRLRQEWILGVAGVRLLRALGIEPAAWHANEGHASFMFVERLRELTAEGVPFDDAVRRVRATSVFTTHTPVPAGHDTFPPDDVERCAGPLWESMGVDRDTFFALGRDPGDSDGKFHMTVAAVRLAAHVNGVARRHGEVTRSMWRHLWPGRPVERVPITHVTNGVHLATWMADALLDFLDGYLGAGWDARLDDAELARGIDAIDDAALWTVHQQLKDRLLGFLVEEARKRWRHRWHEAAHVVGAGAFLSRDALTLGFARRFATYKRADLVFHDPDRLRRLLVDPRRPVQLVFAGKAHPADEHGKQMLQRVYGYSRDPSFEGRIAFVEDYDMHVAHRLVEGTDAWINLPRVPLEACGTSGMKAALNGVPQIGTLDGWWAEGFTGDNGWAVDPAAGEQAVDHEVAECFYDLLEREVVPLYYARNGAGVPRGWIATMKRAMVIAASRFSARRMLQDYSGAFYARAVSGSGDDDPPNGSAA